MGRTCGEPFSQTKALATAHGFFCRSMQGPRVPGNFGFSMFSNLLVCYEDEDAGGGAKGGEDYSGPPRESLRLLNGAVGAYIEGRFDSCEITTPTTSATTATTTSTSTSTTTTTSSSTTTTTYDCSAHEEPGYCTDGSIKGAKSFCAVDPAKFAGPVLIVNVIKRIRQNCRVLCGLCAPATRGPPTTTDAAARATTAPPTRVTQPTTPALPAGLPALVCDARHGGASGEVVLQVRTADDAAACSRVADRLNSIMTTCFKVKQPKFKGTKYRQRNAVTCSSSASAGGNTMLVYAKNNLNKKLNLALKAYYTRSGTKRGTYLSKKAKPPKAPPTDAGGVPAHRTLAALRNNAKGKNCRKIATSLDAILADVGFSCDSSTAATLAATTQAAATARPTTATATTKATTTKATTTKAVATAAAATTTTPAGPATTHTQYTSGKEAFAASGQGLCTDATGKTPRHYWTAPLATPRIARAECMTHCYSDAACEAYAFETQPWASYAAAWGQRCYIYGAALRQAADLRAQWTFGEGAGGAVAGAGGVNTTFTCYTRTPHAAGTPAYTYAGPGNCADAEGKHTLVYGHPFTEQWYDCQGGCTRDPDCQAYSVHSSHSQGLPVAASAAVGRCYLFGERFRGPLQTVARELSGHPVHVEYARLFMPPAGGARPVKGDGGGARGSGCYLKAT